MSAREVRSRRAHSGGHATRIARLPRRGLSALQHAHEQLWMVMRKAAACRRAAAVLRCSEKKEDSPTSIAVLPSFTSCVLSGLAIVASGALDVCSSLPPTECAVCLDAPLRAPRAPPLGLEFRELVTQNL